MKTIFDKANMMTGLVVIAMMVGVSGQAGMFPFSYTDSGAVPQGGTTFSAEHVISSITMPDPSITSIELILTFNNSVSLGATSDLSTLRGSLNLGTDVSSPYVSFTPVISSTSGGNAIYDVTFTGSSGTPGAGFDGLNPNGTWGLVLWDTGTTGFENGLVGWNLDITAVPEPVNVALGVFGVALAAGGGIKWLRRQNKTAAV